MQFNFVISANKAAVALWQKQGFSIAGKLPKLSAPKVGQCGLLRNAPFPETRLVFKLALRLVDYIGWVLHP